MVNRYRLVIKSEGGESHSYDYDPAKGFQVHKRAHGIEVVFRDEPSSSYYAVTWPWHNVESLWAYGTLERKS